MRIFPRTRAAPRCGLLRCRRQRAAWPLLRGLWLVGMRYRRFRFRRREPGTGYTSRMTEIVALVTGASRRVGAEIARQLHDAGARVMLHCRSSRHEAEALAAELNG